MAEQEIEDVKADAETKNDPNAQPEYQPAENISAPADQSGRTASPVSFPETQGRTSDTRLTLDRFADVQVELSVQIGRVNMPLGDLLNLGQGSVVKLNRDISAPVSVMAQGKRIAGGEVVVLDDKYAVRITSIDGTAGLQGE